MSASYILSDSLFIMHCITDFDGNILKTNDLFKEYASHIKPRKITDVINDNDDLETYLLKVNKAKELSPSPVEMFTLIKQKTGENHYMMWNVYVFLASINFVGTEIPDLSSKVKIQNHKHKKLLQNVQFSLNHDVLNYTSSIERVAAIMEDEFPNSENLKIIIDCNAKQKVNLATLILMIARGL